jgi:cytidylate kinase
VSREVAAAIDWIYVDSGSLYRGMTWKALREDVDVKNREQVVEMMTRIQWEFMLGARGVRFTIDGIDPGQDLRNEPVRENVSDIAAIPEVRSFIVQQLRDMKRFGNLVMEGRDIGSVVFPSSPFKYYLDADPAERARRRALELQASEGNRDVNKVMDSLQRRDKKDSTRKTAPLQIALGAKVINSTDMSIEDVVAYIVKDLKELGAL